MLIDTMLRYSAMMINYRHDVKSTLIYLSTLRPIFRDTLTTGHDGGTVFQPNSRREYTYA